METGRKSKQDDAWVKMGWGDAICSLDVRGVAAFVGIEYSALTLQDSSPALSELVSSQVELGPSQGLLDRREAQTPGLRNERALGDIVIPCLEPSLLCSLKCHLFREGVLKPAVSFSLSHKFRDGSVFLSSMERISVQ